MFKNLLKMIDFYDFTPCINATASTCADGKFLYYRTKT